MKQVAESRAGYEAGQPIPKEDIAKLIKDLERQMKEAAKGMEFERAALMRDQIYELRATLADAGDPDADLMMASAANGTTGTNGRVKGNGLTGDTTAVLAAEAAAARQARAARSPARYG